MSFRCVVIDDEKPARDKIKRFLSDHRDFEIAGEAANADDAVHLIDDTEPDLCFLDVQMPEGDGFEVLRRIRHLPGVIFTTAFDQYAVQAFEVRSLDYLLKPFSRVRFAEALDRARVALVERPGSGERLVRLLQEIRAGLRLRDRTEQPEPQNSSASGPLVKISGKHGTRIVLLDPPAILWFEAEETLVFARTADGRFLIERTLTDLEKQLVPAFFRAHRRYLVNLSQIAEIRPGDAGTYRIRMHRESSESVPLSRRQARKLKELIPW